MKDGKIYKVGVEGVVHRVVILRELDRDCVLVQALEGEPFKMGGMWGDFMHSQGRVARERLVPEGRQK